MRKLVRLAAAAVVVITGIAVTNQVADASADACTGQGTMVTGPPVFHPGLGPSASGPIQFWLSIGGCLLDPGSHGSGWYAEFTANPAGNHCGAATGWGSFAGHSFSFTWTADLLIFSGSIVGFAEIQPDALSGESCVSGADRFIVTKVLLLLDNPPPVTIPTVTTTSIPLPPTTTTSIPLPPTTTTSIPLPVLGGGPAGPSTTCGAGVGYNNDNPVEITARVVTSSSIEVCVRAASYGGKFMITPGGTGLPTVPPLPTTDSNATACTSTSGNTIGGDHPLVGPGEIDPGDHTYFIDAYASGDQVWVCAQASSESERLLLTLPTIPGGPSPTITFEPDTGTPDPL